jgi:hypothetical protein
MPTSWSSLEDVIAVDGLVASPRVLPIELERELVLKKVLSSEGAEESRNVDEVDTSISRLCGESGTSDDLVTDVDENEEIDDARDDSEEIGVDDTVETERERSSLLVPMSSLRRLARGFTSSEGGLKND